MVLVPVVAPADGTLVELEDIGSSVESLSRVVKSQKGLFQSLIDRLQVLVVVQWKLTGVIPLSQEMAAGALSIKIDISNRAEILLSRWSKMFGRSQAPRNTSSRNLPKNRQEIIRKDRIGDIFGDGSWPSKMDLPDEILVPSGSIDDSRKEEPKRAMKLLESSDGSTEKHGRNVSSAVDGNCKSATGLQLPGVLDDMFAYTEPLGAVFSKEAIRIHLWAPTAQMVHVYVYKDPFGGDPLDYVQLKEQNSVWSFVGPRSWEGCYYVYEVSVYHPSTSQIETYTVNDPYARGISSDGNALYLSILTAKS